MKKYLLQVEAIQVTEKLIEAIAYQDDNPFGLSRKELDSHQSTLEIWEEGEGELSLHVTDEWGNDIESEIGDWLIRFAKWKFLVLTNKEFEKLKK